MLDKAHQFASHIVDTPIKELSSDQLKTIISLIDYTTLNDTDTNTSVSDWMDESIRLMESVSCYCGGWCTYSEFAPLLREKRNGLPINIAVVSANFPSGKALSQIKIDESALSEALGAEEIDIVINKGWAKENEFAKIEKEVNSIKGVLENAHLKVIMETGLLTEKQIEETSKSSIRAGADFIKTSTGKTEKGASLEAVAIMCLVIKEHFEKTGKRIGIKPSGGISTPEEAWQYVSLVKTILGDEWINSSLFRIGASRLLSNTVNALKNIG